MSANQTLVLSLLTGCQRILKDTRVDISDQQGNTTPSSTTYNQSQVSKALSSRETYDNAYLYILFVMLFYTFLATTLFKCFISSDGEENNSDEEFVSTAQSSTQTFNTGHMEEKFYFEEENSL